jgi:hypothetical protein
VDRKAGLLCTLRHLPHWEVNYKAPCKEVEQVNISPEAVLQRKVSQPGAHMYPRSKKSAPPSPFVCHSLDAGNLPRSIPGISLRNQLEPGPSPVSARLAPLTLGPSVEMRRVIEARIHQETREVILSKRRERVSFPARKYEFHIF